LTPWPYDLTAEFYDEDMGRNADSRDIPWYVALASAAAAGTGGPVLELGCGTGRITLPLAAAGLDVVAIDRSLPMLQVLARKAAAAGLAGRIRSAAQDMSRLGLDQRFAAILCPFSAFGYLLRETDRSRTLADVRRCLASGGVFLLDMFILDPSLDGLKDGTEIEDYCRRMPPGPWAPAVTLTRSKRLWREIQSGVNSVERLYRFLDEAGMLVREVRTVSWQSLLQPAKLLSELESAGFTDLRSCGDFESDTPVAPPARTMAVIARPEGG